MNDSAEARAGRVMRVVEAARRVADDSSIVSPLAASTGLSREGVELALREHLETNPTDAEVHTLVERAGSASHVHVILSANVFTGALRAIAVAVAAAPSVSVHVSSREPTFARSLIDAIGNQAIFTVDRGAPSNMREGEIHVYGRAETIVSVRARCPKGVSVRGHGPGLGIACIMQTDPIPSSATFLARDVVPFDQRGCLSPRVAFVVGDQARAESFAERLCAALMTLGERVPRGTLSDDEGAEAARYIETMRFAGSASIGRGYAVGVAASLIVPPPGRYVHVVPVADMNALRQVLLPVETSVTAVGSSDREIASFFRHSVRGSPLGKMQKPPFDGPVDLRAL